MHSTVAAAAAAAARAEAEARVIKSWEDIGKDDLKQLVASLRAVGCPEETVRDIILAEVNRIYQAKNRAAYPEIYGDRPYWQVEKRDVESQKRSRERSKQMQQLQNEKSELLVELLGVDPEKLMREEDGISDAYSSWAERKLAFLPEAKRAEALKFIEEFEEKRQDFHARNRGLYDDIYRAEQKQLEAEELAGLSKILSPQELREYELRNSQTASQLRYDLQGLSLTRDQYEAIYDVRKKYGDSIYNYGDIEGQAARDQVEANKKAMQAELMAALGPEAGRKYERSQDYAYKQLAGLAKRYNLPETTADTVYDGKSAAEASVKAINENANLSSQEKEVARQKIRDETESLVKSQLGEDNFKRYQRTGGYWINNLSPARRPPVSARP